MKIKLIYIFFFASFPLFSQTIHKIEDSKLKEINYILSPKTSDVELLNYNDFVKKFTKKMSSSELINLREKDDITYISSLYIFSFKDGKLIYTPINDNFEPNKIVAEFLSENIKYRDFGGLTNKTKLGIYFSYNNKTSLMVVEICEVRKKKYHLIFREEVLLKDD